MTDPSLGEPLPPLPTLHCPGCGAELPPGAVLCVACGYDLKEGRQLETVREPLVDELLTRVPNREESAYQPPEPSLAAPVRKKELEKNLDLETRVFWLEERLRELERRVNGTRLTAPEFTARMFAVLGLWLLGFVAVAFCVGAVALLVWGMTVGL
jgi:hypothetical protein